VYARKDSVRGSIFLFLLPIKRVGSLIFPANAYHKGGRKILMERRRIVVVYNKVNRELSGLEKACSQLKLSLHVSMSVKELQRELSTGLVMCIIVPVGSKTGGEDAKVFAETMLEMLQPENCDLTIIYSSKKSFPEKWPSPPLDPRLIKDFDNDPQLVPFDTNWLRTIEKLKTLKQRFRYPCNPKGRRVQVKFVRPSIVPFPTEAGFLIRSAFKDMSKVVIESPRQGLSGSMVFAVQPDLVAGKTSKKFLAKIYPDERKAWEEYERFQSHVKKYFSLFHYRQPDDARRYHGRGYSIFVTDLVTGPNGQPITLKDMITSKDFTSKQLTTFVSEILSALDDAWGRTYKIGSVNLEWDYLRYCLKDELRRRNLESENFYHSWFGPRLDNVPFQKKLRLCGIPISLRGTKSRICHGDLHGDNIMVGHYKNNLIPVFIDFSRTGPKHSIMDLVTLESDAIIRCLDITNIQSFLKGLRFRRQKVGAHVRGSIRCQNQLRKVEAIINALRQNAILVHKVDEGEYTTAALLKTLEILSYKLLQDQNERATTYVSYLCERIRRLSKV